MKNDLPVVYALIPIKDDILLRKIGSYSLTEDLTIHYMICKCYLCSLTMTYLKLSDQWHTNVYKVSLPFKRRHGENNDIWERIYYPSQDLLSTTCISTSYEEVKKIRENIFQYSDRFSVDRARFKRHYGSRYDEIINHYYEIEKLFEENLESLKVSELNNDRQTYTTYEEENKEPYVVYINDEKVRKRVKDGEDIRDLSIYI